MASLSVRCALNQHPSIRLSRGANRPDPNQKRISPDQPFFVEETASNIRHYDGDGDDAFRESEFRKQESSVFGEARRLDARLSGRDRAEPPQVAAAGAGLRGRRRRRGAAGDGEGALRRGLAGGHKAVEGRRGLSAGRRHSRRRDLRRRRERERERKRKRYEGVGGCGSGEGREVRAGLLFVEDEPGRVGPRDGLYPFLFGTCSGFSGKCFLPAHPLLVGVA
ncbi:hypothetical protein Acr_02g0002920 [Actinidia rufa]|uniref:Uncharacterized protein n=1 Tax=Actinidia rufa TaxID=165716 RepID=A0A7J0E6Z5_9ERIC|nr:hypothetical protein Acr_02g0002920 [Actinidia rufa]